MIHQRGQSTVEYAVLLAVIIAALLAVQIYVKRGAMGRLRSSTDSIGEQFNPHVVTAEAKEVFSSSRSDTVFPYGVSKSMLTKNETQTTEQGAKEEMITGKAEISKESLFHKP